MYHHRETIYSNKEKGLQFTDSPSKRNTQVEPTMGTAKDKHQAILPKTGLLKFLLSPIESLRKVNTIKMDFLLIAANLTWSLLTC